VTDRERVLIRVCTAPLVKGDAIVVLCGEDAMPRALKALDLLVQGVGRYILLSGGDSGPGAMSAIDVEPKLLALSVMPHVILRDDASKNTHEQAENVLALARRHGWRRLALVASPYHLPRAFCTFLRSLSDAGMDEDVYIMPAPVDGTRWTEPPADTTHSRTALLETDVDKCDVYGEHVASWSDALDYLDYWERQL
jgi:uncharacterized SAM-binding protein YcdF (DUF218 family)